MNKRVLQPFFIGCVLCATATAFILKNEPASISPPMLRKYKCFNRWRRRGNHYLLRKRIGYLSDQ